MSEDNGSTPGEDGAGSGKVQKRKRAWQRFKKGSSDRQKVMHFEVTASGAF
jgi:hypothetical protein